MRLAFCRFGRGWLRLPRLPYCRLRVVCRGERDQGQYRHRRDRRIPYCSLRDAIAAAKPDSAHSGCPAGRNRGARPTTA